METSPNGHTLAAVTLRSNGYHVAVASAASQDAVSLASGAVQLAAAPPIDSQALAPGDYHSYSALRSALPHYWYPFLQQAPGRGTRLGATTSGYDVLGRHIYSALLAVPTTGSYPVAQLAYRYAGLRRPFIDVFLSQDYTSDGALLSGGTKDTVGTLLRRSQNASLALTVVRPRYRTFTSFSLGSNIERRTFKADPDQYLKQLSAIFANTYYYPSAFVSGGWSNLQRPALSISAEDGISVSLTARERARTDSVSATASASVIGIASMYKSLDLPGFAHHVLALRLAGGIADKRAATSLEVGGTSGSTIEIVPGYYAGEGRRTFGVRGFPSGSVYGTSAATGTLEYRAPLLLGGRGIGALPFFFDRSSLAAFADAGVATCVALPRYPTICSPSPVIGRTIASVGGELGLAAAVLDWDRPQNIRVGFAIPVAGTALVRVGAASAYLAFGLSY